MTEPSLSETCIPAAPFATGRIVAESPHELFNNPGLTIAEAARLYGVPPLIIRKAIERGELALTEIGGQQLLSREAVLGWLKDRRAGWA